MANGCTRERRARPADLILHWRPWERSTASKSAEGKARVSRKGDKGGVPLMLRESRRALKEREKARRCHARKVGSG